MTYQLIVTQTSSQEIMTKIIALPKRSAFRGKLSMHDLHDGKTVEITFSVDSLSVDIEEMEQLLTKAVSSGNSNVVSWKRID